MEDNLVTEQLQRDHVPISIISSNFGVLWFSTGNPLENSLVFSCFCWDVSAFSVNTSKNEGFEPGNTKLIDIVT